MEFTLSGNALKQFASAIESLASIDEKIAIKATSSQILFHAANDLSKAYQWFTAKLGLFDVYKLSGLDVKCSVHLKAICADLESHIKNTDTLSVLWPDVDASKILLTLRFPNGTIKLCRIGFKVDTDIPPLALDRRNFPSDLIVRPQDLNRLLAKFQSSIQGIAIIAMDPDSLPADSANDIGPKAVGLRCFVDPTKDIDSSLPTQLWIDPAEEFVHYSHSRDPVDVTFSVKELKAFVAFCEASEVDIHLYFNRAGKPVIMAPKSRYGDGCSLNFDAKLVIATMPRSILQWGHTSGPSAVLREREIENPSMEWRLSGNALKMFAGAINCLASIGTKLAIHATPSQILFHTANNSDVAHQWITVTPDLFDVYKVPDLEVECSVRLKAIRAVLKTPVTNNDTLSVLLTHCHASKMLWTMHFPDGREKSHEITCKVEPGIHHCNLDIKEFRSNLIVRPQEMNVLLSNFPSSIQDITMIATDPNSFHTGSANDICRKAVELRNYVDPTKENDLLLRIQLWVDPAKRFVHYFHSRDPVDVTFAVKELKAFVAFCETCKADIHLYFDHAGMPVVMISKPRFADDPSLNIDAILLLATNCESELHGGYTIEPSSGGREQPHGSATGNVSDHTKIWSDMSGSGSKSGTRGPPFYLLHFDHVNASILGRGSFGVVYLARDKLDGKDYAVKIIRFITSNYHKMIREVEIMSGLDHKHVVRHHKAWLDYGLDDICIFKEESEHEDVEGEEDDFDDEEKEDDEGEEEGAEDEVDVGVGAEENVAEDEDDVGVIGEEENVAEYEVDEGLKDMAAEYDEEMAGDGEGEGGKDFNFLCIQMAYYPSTLRARLKPFKKELAVKWFRQIVEGIAYLHERDIVHGDLHIANVFVDEDDNIKIGDFGSARHQGLDEGLAIRNKKDDIASLGEIFFRLNHPGRSFSHEVGEHGKMRTATFSRAWEKKFPSHCAFIRRLTSVNPDDRPSAQLLLDELIDNA